MNKQGSWVVRWQIWLCFKILNLVVITCLLHDDMEMYSEFLYYWPFVMGLHWWLVNFPHKGPEITEIWCFFIPPPNEVGGGVYWIHYTPAQRSWRGGILDSPCPSVCPSVRPSVCRRHGFRSISQVCFGISIPNFICMLMVAIGRSLLIFSDITFKMAARRPYWIFWFPDSNLLRLWISTSNFSGTIFMYMGRSLLIFSNVIFKMAAWRPYQIFWFLDSVGDKVSGM